MARSTVILAVIAGALLAFILLHERDLLSSKELEARKNRVLTSFVRDRVSRVELVRAGENVVLERAPDPELDGLLGTWRQTAPMQVAVDQEAVDVLLGELEWLQPRRVIENLNAEDQERFGFKKPRIEVHFNIGKQRSVLLVGADEPTGLGLYARGEDPDTAYIVGKDLFEALDHDGGHFHTKELHKGVFVFAATALVTKTAAGQGRAELRDGTWWTDAPTKTILSSVDVEAAIKAFDTLRAKRFVASKITGPETYGLNSPSLTLTVERKQTVEGGNAPVAPITLRVGAQCGEHAAEKYIQVDRGPVMCAADEDLNKLSRPVSELIDTSPLPIDPERLVELVLDTPGRSIALIRKEERFRLRVTPQGRPAPQPPQESDAEREAVDEWMKALRALKFVERGADAVAPAGTKLVTLKLKTSATGPVLDVRVIASEDGAVHVLRGQETAWLRFDAAARELLTPFAARFRALELVSEPDAPLTQVTVKQAGVTESVERIGDTWQLKTPFAAEADPILLADVSHLLTRLSAVRFVADAATQEHRLATPEVQVDFSVGKTERTLLFGAPTDGGVFAQLEGDAAVFVVPTRVIETVTQGLLAKTALATAPEHIASARFEAAGRVRQITRAGERFINPDADMTDASITAAIDRIVRLRAQTLAHYGAALPAEGFARPQLKVSITRTDAGTQAYELTFGATTGSAEAPEVFVRRSDLNVTLTVAASTFDRLTEVVR